MANETYDKLIELLDKNKAKYRLIDHEPEGRTELVSPMRGNQLSDAANCIVVMVKTAKKETKYLLCVLPGDARVDMDAIKRIFNGSYASLAEQGIAEELAGSVMGTVLPFSFNPELELVVDPNLLGIEEMFFNAARLDRSVALSAKDYERIAKPRIESIAKYQTSGSKKSEEMDPDLYNLRHSCSHVLAQAVVNLWPDTKISIGPPIDYGCYYDFQFKEPITDEDFKKIEKEMRSIINKGQKFEEEKMSADDSIKYWKKMKQPFKVELVEDLKKGGETEVTHYKNVDSKGKETFVDLCAGGHKEDVKEIPADGFKIISLAGAYWRGDEKNQQLTRIYVAVFSSKEELNQHLLMVEEAKKRDHRKIGKELDLFSFHEEAGPGLAYWHPKGAMMRKVMEDFWREEHIKGGYDFVNTPHIGRDWLWKTSGHLDFYKENMYAPMEIDEEEYFAKPMNCPFHILIYKTDIRSYRDLPLRWAELGTVYRYEKSGVLHGLLRVRGFTQDDAHIVCTPEQIEDEIQRVLRFSLDLLAAFGFSDIQAFLSTKPEKAAGDDASWEQTQAALKRAIESEGLKCEVDEGGGVFYGPKIDLKIRDAIGREWQLTTIQFDFNLPERFDMNYIGEDGKEHRPYMVHRALLGSLERFYGILIEHYAGLFPLWLAPVQMGVIPVAEPHAKYAQEVVQKLKDEGLRPQYMDPSESLGKRIREGEKQKYPFLLVLGEKEVSGNSVAVRDVKTKEQVEVPLDEFIKRAVEDVKERRL